MEPYLEDIEKEHVDLRQFTTAAGLATILTKIFQVRSVSLDRVPTFVAKDKSNLKVRLLTGKTRKMTIRGHHFVAHQYFKMKFSLKYCTRISGMLPSEILPYTHGSKITGQEKKEKC